MHSHVQRGNEEIPGMDSFSKLHDEWVRGGVSEIFNYGSMPPALAVNYASIYGQNFTAIDILRRKGGKR